MAAQVDPESRRQARLEQRRRRLLQAALALFADKGFHLTSVEDVVGAARMSKSAFYEFFQSKEDCFCALLEQEGGAVIHQIVDAAAEGGDHRDRMCGGIRAFVRLCTGRSAPVARMMVVESVGLTPRVESLRRTLQERFVNMVAEEVRQATTDRDPFYAAVDPLVFGRAVVGAVNEAVGHLLADGGEAGPVADGLCLIFAPPRPL
ncbi:MAG TPA: TetR/AcrR family transcriptional regulator [Candidatus Dormibacteraeota bacterium]